MAREQERELETNREIYPSVRAREREQDKVKTNQGKWLNTIARAKAQGKARAERALALEAKLEQDKVKTSPGRWLNIAGREKE